MYNVTMVRSLVYLAWKRKTGKENVTFWMCCGSRGYLNYVHMIVNLLIVIPFLAYRNAGYGLAIAMTQIFNQVLYIFFGRLAGEYLLIFMPGLFVSILLFSC